MSTKRITKKSFIKNFNGEIFSVSYCGIQNILKYRQPDYYTTRIEGWACDIYIIVLPSTKTIAVTTGYAPFGKQLHYNLYNVFEQISYQYTDNKKAFDWLLYLLIAYANAGYSTVEQKTIENVMQILLADG